MPYKLPVTAGYKQPMQVLLPILPLLQFKPPSSIMKDKISITPFFIKLLILSANSMALSSRAKLRKNVIGGAIRDDVFQHKKESGHLKQCVQML